MGYLVLYACLLAGCVKVPLGMNCNLNYVIVRAKHLNSLIILLSTGRQKSVQQGKLDFPFGHLVTYWDANNHPILDFCHLFNPYSKGQD